MVVEAIEAAEAIKRQLSCGLIWKSTVLLQPEAESPTSIEERERGGLIRQKAQKERERENRRKGEKRSR